MIDTSAVLSSLFSDLGKGVHLKGKIEHSMTMDCQGRTRRFYFSLHYGPPFLPTAKHSRILPANQVSSRRAHTYACIMFGVLISRKCSRKVFGARQEGGGECLSKSLCAFKPRDPFQFTYFLLNHCIRLIVLYEFFHARLLPIPHTLAHSWRSASRVRHHC